MKEFNTTAVCIPSKHYMVDLSERVKEIKKLVDAGKYFVINRARQYGKTTTLIALEHELRREYYVVSMDLQDYGEDTFSDAESFCRDFSSEFCSILEEQTGSGCEDLRSEIRNFMELSEDIKKPFRMFTMFRHLQKICEKSKKSMVLIIDEVDSIVNNRLLIDFLAGLRSNYIKREKNSSYKTFQSVILAGVTDVRYLKGKLRPEEEGKENSPWNIAANFTIDMSLSVSGIRGMLEEYEMDHHTGMDTEGIAKLVYEYTNGYPFLVSRICQLMDESVSTGWTRGGVEEAVKLLLSENNTLFQSLTKNLNFYPALKASIRSILMEGTKLAYNPQQDATVQMQMYGLVRNDHNTVRVANRIFETMLYNLFLSEEELKHSVFAREGELAKNRFVEDGRLNMALILERFIVTYTQVCGPLKERFLEKDGREQFLLYLKPIINGTGNYYIEAQTRDQTRTDVIIDYLGKQYIVELKIWRGERYHAEGEKQIRSYLEYFGLTTGYMLSFNFNKKKEQGVKRVQMGDKVLFEGTV